MARYFQYLDESVEKKRVLQAVKEILKSLRENEKLTFPRLARRIAEVAGQEITPDAIRLFLADETQRNRVNSGNVTIAALYDFIIVDHHRFGPATLNLFYELREELGLLGPSLADDAAFAIGAQQWVHASADEVDRLTSKMRGKFVALRRSTLNSWIMKSTLEVTREREDGQFYLKARHGHHDRGGRPRTSSGFLVPVVRNIYAALQVEGHEGLEIIVLRDPIQARPEFFMGFMLGVNGDRNIYNSSLLLERVGSDTEKLWDALPHRFPETHPGLAALGDQFTSRLRQVLSERSSRLLTRFQDAPDAVDVEMQKASNPDLPVPEDAP